MQSSDRVTKPRNSWYKSLLGGALAIFIGVCLPGGTASARAAGGSTNTLADLIATGSADPVLNLLVEKGMITEEEANKVQAQVDARRTNMAAEYAGENSKWKISKDIKDMEIFGDLRLRYESRRETDPSGGRINLDRFRYALRVGLRGDLVDDFYYGFRLETSSNPRSSWVTMGTSSSGAPYSGPYGKSTAGLSVGQLYLGWQASPWLDFELGKMPNPLYTSSMVWSPSINPEGLAEKLEYTVGQMDFYITCAQFLYQDENPDSATRGLFGTGIGPSIGTSQGQEANNIVQVAWEGGFKYRILTNLSVKVETVLYKYYGDKKSRSSQAISPYFGDYYVGEGAYLGTNYATLYPNGASGYNTLAGTLQPGYQSLGYPNNQVGLDFLSVLEFPFEINYRFRNVDFRAFGDFAYNIQGDDRARQAAKGYADFLNYEQTTLGLPVTVQPFKAQTHDVEAYEFGLAVGSKDAIGLVNGSVSKKHAWEARAYWQHIEQYSLDPNLLDLDYFAGAENLEGIYGAIAYGFNDNFIATLRYGYASRINHVLGTGGTGTDIQQINPINYYNLIQVDLTFKF
jgi:hypothetical protein